MFNLFKKNKKKTEKSSTEENKGIIGKYIENGFPVIVRFVNEIPEQELITKMRWFTVISWKYNGSEKNGMPPDSINNRMIELEKALDSTFEKNRICKHAFNRTGNNLKEFNYYISDRDKFMVQFNKALAKHKPYPIEINFYEDPDWTEMNTLIKDFN